MLYRLLLILVCLLLAADAKAQAACDRVTPFQYIAAAGPTEIVPGIANQRIYLCGYMLSDKATTLDFQLSSGTGTNCATDTAPLTPQISLPNSVVFVNRIERVGPYSPPGHALCVQTFGTGTLTGAIYWAQF